MRSIGLRFDTSNYVVRECRLRRGTALLHHHPPYRLSPKREGRLTWLIRLDLELLMLVHHIDEPVVGFTRYPLKREAHPGPSSPLPRIDTLPARPTCTLSAMGNQACHLNAAFRAHLNFPLLQFLVLRHNHSDSPQIVSGAPGVGSYSSLPRLVTLTRSD